MVPFLDSNYKRIGMTKRRRARLYRRVVPFLDSLPAAGRHLQAYWNDKKKKSKIAD
ncbi:MAG: hypothetical protein WC139_05435 [Candidatus Kapaibacterium sp.]